MRVVPYSAVQPWTLAERFGSTSGNTARVETLWFGVVAATRMTFWFGGSGRPLEFVQLTFLIADFFDR